MSDQGPWPGQPTPAGGQPPPGWGQQPAPGPPPPTWGTPPPGAETPPPGAGTPPPGAGGPPPGWGGQPPPGAAPAWQAEAPKKGGRRAATIVLVVLLVAVLGVGGFLALRFTRGASDTLAQRVPGDALMYLHLNLRPGAADLMGLSSFAEQVGQVAAAAGQPLPQLNADRAVGDLVDAIFNASDVDLTYDRDVAPWLGDQLAVYVAPPAQQDAEAEVAVLLASTDDTAALGFARTAYQTGGDTVQDVTIGDRPGVSGGDTVAAADDGVLVIGTLGAVERVVAVTPEGALPTVDRYAPVRAALPGGVLFGWFDAARFAELALGAAGMPAMPGLPFGDVAGGFALRLRTGELIFDTAAIGGPTTPPSAAALTMAELPAGGQLYFRVPALGATANQQLDQLGSFLEMMPGAIMPDAEGEAGENPRAALDQAVQEAVGQSLSQILGWVGDLGFYVRYTPPADDSDPLAGLSTGLVIGSGDPVSSDALAARVSELAAELGLPVEAPPGGLPGVVVPAQPGQPGFGVVGNGARLYAGTSSALQELGNPATARVGDEPRFDAAFAGLAGEPVFYLDIASTIATIRTAAPLFGDPPSEMNTVLDGFAGFTAFAVTTEPAAEGRPAVGHFRLAWTDT